MNLKSKQLITIGYAVAQRTNHPPSDNVGSNAVQGEREITMGVEQIARGEISAIKEMNRMPHSPEVSHA